MQSLEDLDLGCGCAFDLGYGVGQVRCVVPFDDQYTYLSFCRRCHDGRVVFLISLPAFGTCSGEASEIGTESSARKMSCAVDGEARIFEEGWDCELRGKESVSLAVFWVNVSERLLKVSRILFGHHPALDSSDPSLCCIYGAVELGIC